MMISDVEAMVVEVRVVGEGVVIGVVTGGGVVIVVIGLGEGMMIMSGFGVVGVGVEGGLFWARF